MCIPQSSLEENLDLLDLNHDPILSDQSEGAYEEEEAEELEEGEEEEESMLTEPTVRNGNQPDNMAGGECKIYVVRPSQGV